MSLQRFPAGQETASEANKWLGLIDLEGLWVHQDEDEAAIPGDPVDVLRQLLQTYCER